MERFKGILKSLKSNIIILVGLIYATLGKIFDKSINAIKMFDYKENFKNIKYDLLEAKRKIMLSIKNFDIKNYSKRQRYVAGFLVICFIVTFSNDFEAMSQNLIERSCKVVVVDGQPIIKIPDSIDVDVVEELDKKLTEAEGRDVEITSNIEIVEGVGYGYEVNLTDEIVKDLMNEVEYEVLVPDFRLDDEHVAYVESIPELTEILDEIKAPYEDPKYSLVKFKEEVTFDEMFVPKSEISTPEEVKEMLQGNKEEKNVHTVVEGDTLWDLSIENEVTVDDLLYVNPGLTEDSLLQLGEEVVISNSVPMISVMTYERVNYDAPAPYETTTVQNNEEYVTYKEVKTQGVDGVKNVTADIVSTNGVETDRLIVDETIKVEPVTEVIEVGTMNTPPKKAIGTFAWPCTGRISDRFMARGGEHKGIDIANSYGTPIKASDGGYVEFVGWQDGYGNLVIINHENGYKTYYGHNSSIVVTQGQRVAQGDVIAKMGSTGRSTGNHCHFEVRANGVPQNPFDYLTY